MGDAHEETVPLNKVFGPNVNIDLNQEESDANLDNIPNRIPPHVTQKASASIGIGSNSEELGEPGADLPPNNPCPSCYLES